MNWELFEILNSGFTIRDSCFIAGKEKMNDKQNNTGDLARVMALGLELGFAIATPLIVFLLIGVWIDRKIGTLPIFVIIFLLVGLIAVVLEVRYLIVPFLEKRSQNKNSENK